MEFSTEWLFLSSNVRAGNQGRFLFNQFFGSTSPNANERTDIQQMGRPFALTGHVVKIRHTGWQKSLASSTGTSRTKESQAWQVGILLCSNVLHSFVIQYDGFCTMWPVSAKNKWTAFGSTPLFQSICLARKLPFHLHKFTFPFRLLTLCVIMRIPFLTYE